MTSQINGKQTSGCLGLGLGQVDFKRLERNFLVSWTRFMS